MQHNTLVTQIVILLVLCLAVHSNFTPKSVRVVDSHHKNYLVRGNLPILNKEFRMDLLKDRLKEVTGLKKISELKVISLMNHLTVKESTHSTIEEEYFLEHPEEGQLEFYPVLGYFFPPTYLPVFLTDLISHYYERFSYDKLDAFLDRIHRELQMGKNKIIYWHCSLGVDRTGLVSGAYKMKYMGASLKEVLQENASIINRNIKWNTFNGLLWFCEHLQRKNPKLDCAEGGFHGIDLKDL